MCDVVEGLLNHYVFNVHHVRPGPNHATYDIAFLIFSAPLAVGGLAWYRRTTRSAGRTDSRQTASRS